jgi:sec-independent protein translocase protein TatB
VFDSVGWSEILVLGIAGLFILGPERLPAAAAWLGRSIRKVREFASGARDQLRSEMGPEFDELRKPLQDLQQLRSFDPKRAVARHLFDDEPANGSNGSSYKPNGYTPPLTPPAIPEPPPTLYPGEKAPYDPDAT